MNTRNQTTHEMGLDSSNFLKFHGPFFPSQRTTFKEVKRGVTIDLPDASRLTVLITRPLANRSFCLMTVRSRMKGQDVISSNEEGVRRFRSSFRSSSNDRDLI